MPTKFLGAIERTPDERDFPLGAVAVKGTRPTTRNADVSWLERNYQAELPFCGPHAGTHNKAIQDHDQENVATPHYTPRFTAIRMKDPSSPVYDGYAPDVGTDMRSLLKAFQTAGANTFEPLQNDTALSIGDYLTPSAVTPAMIADAGTRLIKSYAFGNADYDSIADAVWNVGSAIVLIKCDDGFWGTATPTFTNADYGHFVTVYDWNDEEGCLYVVDSAEPNPAFALKKIAKQYVTPTFFRELGTTVDLPPSVHAALSSGQIAIAQQILIDIQKAISLIKQEL
jgi:hypothetical protein